MEIIDGYLYFETNKTVATKKKMTGHDFVNLVGLNPFTKPGDTILSMLGIYKKDFDVKYMYRGNFAEMFVMVYYTRVLKRQYIYHDEKDKKENNYDFFPNKKQCGGIPDLEMLDRSEIVEIKSKSMSKYQDIAIREIIPEEELYQGLFYSVLKNVQETTMVYVFFDEETEKLIFENKKPNTLNNIKIYTKTYNTNMYYTDVKDKIIKALRYYNDCIRYKRIPIADISENVLQALEKDIIKEYNVDEL